LKELSDLVCPKVSTAPVSNKRNISFFISSCLIVHIKVAYNESVFAMAGH